MKILITGLGIVGKSTFRRKLFKWLREMGLAVKQYDCDYDRGHLPLEFKAGAIYLIEDVHGPTSQAVFTLSSFDLIFYLWPAPVTHLRFWMMRMRQWFKTGHLAWDADKGEKGEWAGTGQAYDLANLVLIAKEFWRNWQNRRAWLENDLEMIKKSGVKAIIVVPQAKKGKIYFS